jgi:CNT family concentrative nucleoside transporter
MIGLLGIVTMLVLAVLFSEKRSAIDVAPALRTLGLQVAVAIVALATPAGLAVLSALSAGVQSILLHARAGMEFVFGPLSSDASGFILAFQVLPIIVFVAALLSLLFYLRVMSLIIHFLGGALRVITGASRIESTCAAANIFIGMAEAPLTVLPFLPKISRSQLFVVMGVGLSSVAGTVMLAYAALGVRIDLLLTAAFMAAPGGLLIAKILVPETGEPFDVPSLKLLNETVDSARPDSFVEAIANGASVGLKVMLNVIAALIAFIGLIALLNAILGALGGLVGFPDLSMEFILAYLFAPVSFIIGVPWDEAFRAGTFLGEKVILNEFLAYLHFSPEIGNFSERGQVAVTVALCGFANLTGLAVLIAGLKSIAPERGAEVAKLGLKAVLAGTLANFLSASIVSVITAIQAYALS